MPVWDPTRYLQFADDRSRPFLDLMARIRGRPRNIVDLGCGPGHLTAVLRARWPDATIQGVDSSAEMVQRATTDNRDPAASYQLADVAVWEPTRPVDLIVSNALFQWVPEQLDVIRRLAGFVEPGGTFALQVPRNYSSPSHTLLHDIGAEPAFAEYTSSLISDRGTEPASYLELYSDLGWGVDVWETTYFHVLQGDDPVFGWLSGTGARPHIQALPLELQAEFSDKYRCALRSAYPQKQYGTPFPFRRTLVVAQRGEGLR